MTKRISVLIVEDDKFISASCKIKFTKAGFRVKVAFNGQEALEILKTFHPNVIVLDLIMPIKDGFYVLAKIKNNKKLASIPIIVASNIGGDEEIEKAYDLGATQYIVKSDLTLNDLVERIMHLHAS